MTKSTTAKRHALIAVAALLASAGAVSSAAAADRSTYEFKINARVALFCRISAPFEGLPLPASAIQEDGIQLGAVTETCNSGSGYRVEARFQNVRTGTLMLDERPQSVIDGLVSYSHPRASQRVRQWRLADFESAAVDQPILVRLSISPL